MKMTNAAGDVIFEISPTTGAIVKEAGTAFTPPAHAHPVSEVTSLQATLDSKAASTHTHAQSDVTNLVTDLAGKAASGHTHVKANITDFAHTHVKADVTDFAHTHQQGDVTNLVSDLAGKAASSHTHAAGDLPDLDGITAPNASVDFNGQQATSFRIENRTSDPASPAVGQIWLRTDL